MKKKLLASVLTIAMFTAIVGCGSSKTTEVPAEKTTTEAVKAEEVTTEAPAPEVATTEAKIEVVEIDPESYIWSDEEKIIYEDNIATIEFYKEWIGENWLAAKVFDRDTGKLKETITCNSAYYVNNFIKVLYECKSVAESFQNNGEVIDYMNDPIPEKDLTFSNYSIPSEMKLKYINGSDSFCFFVDDNGIMKFAKTDNDDIVWGYEISDRIKVEINKMIWYGYASHE